MTEQTATHAAGALALEANGLLVQFGGIRALDGVDFSVIAGEIHGLIGPNGAGKSTLLNVLAGVIQPQEGRLAMLDAPLRRQRPSRRARLGLARTFQAPTLFGSLTISENLQLARRRQGPCTPEAQEWLAGLVDGLGLRTWENTLAASVPHPVRKLVDVVRALALAPRVLLVDEPAAGLPSEDRDELADLLSTARDQLGCAIVLIEHDVPLVFRLCDRVTVLSNGRVIADADDPEAIRAHPEVVAAYLGTPV